MCNLSLLLFSLRPVNTVTQSYDTSAVVPQLLLAEDKQRPVIGCQVSSNLHLFYLCLILCSNFWLNRRFQASEQTILLLD